MNSSISIYLPSPVLAGWLMDLARVEKFSGNANNLVSRRNGLGCPLQGCHSQTA